jgi:hypothetical protein
MKTHVTLSLNVKVVEEFFNQVPSGNRSGVIEALMIQYLINYPQGDLAPKDMVEVSDALTQEIK